MFQFAGFCISRFDEHGVVPPPRLSQTLKL
jgi:hypothetical protein